MAAPSVFVSYSRRDGEWMSRLQAHLGVLHQQELIDVWTDERIGPGDAWREEIRQAIERASVAILLVSSHSLSSEFILWKEVPRILERRTRDRLPVLPVLVEPTPWEEVSWLAEMQCVTAGGKALALVDRSEAEEVLANVARSVARLLRQGEHEAPPQPPPPDPEGLRNNSRLYTGLWVFGAALRRFAVERLTGAYGKGWWKAGVVRVLREETTDRLEAQWRKRHAGSLAPDEELPYEELLEVGYLLPVLEGNWKGCFAEAFPDRQKTEVWLREIIEVRNRVMHPEGTPIPDADAHRGLDTMSRFLQLVDRSASERVAQLRDEDPPRAARKATSAEFDGHFETGFRHLFEVVSFLGDDREEAHAQLESLFLQLSNLMWRKELAPGDYGVAQASEIRLLQFRLDALARELTGKSFRELAQPPDEPRQLPPDEAAAAIRQLDAELDRLHEQLRLVSEERDLQRRTGTVLGLVQRKLEHLQRELEAKRKERDHLKETCCPESYFRVKRRLSPDGVAVYRIEQRVGVEVRIHNEGQAATTLVYQEALPQTFERLAGELAIESPVQPGEDLRFEYAFHATHAGEFTLGAGRMEYSGRFPVWDTVADSQVQIEPATEPALEVKRHFDLRRDGLKLLVELRNRGQKIARAVDYREQIGVSGGEPVVMEWRGDIPGGGTEVRDVILAARPGELTFSPELAVGYANSEGRRFRCPVEPTVSRIEYSFPTADDENAPTFGRGDELARLEQVVERPTRGEPGRRLVLIEGIEGTGKTRLVHELRGLAAAFSVHEEDCKSLSPCKRILRRLLGLGPAEHDSKAIWKRMGESRLGGSNELYWRPLLRFLAGQEIEPESEDSRVLETQFPDAVKSLCEGHLTLLVFENLHWAPMGLEEKLLVRLMRSVALDQTSPLVLCATYRPAERAPAPVVGSLGVSRDYIESLRLEPLDRQAARDLLDEIVPFPRFGEDLYRYVAEYSTNPLYLIELVRLLTRPGSKYILRVGGEWQIAPGVSLDKVVPKRTRDLVRQRIEEELPNASELVRSLSAIGFELPRALIDHVAGRRLPGMSEERLGAELATLERAGILAPSDEHEYRFEHQLKREVMYDSLPRHERPKRRQEIAEFLLDNQVFADASEQVRQIALHVVESPRAFRGAHLEAIREAATMEATLGNLAQSIDFFEAAIAAAPEGSFEKVELLVERSVVSQKLAVWTRAARDLQEASRLVAPAQALERADRERARRLRIRVDKRLGLLEVARPGGTLAQANKLLGHARLGLEGPLRARFWFPPREIGFYRDLVELYLGLAEAWMRMGSAKVARRACSRAESLARRAARISPDTPLLALVQSKLGDLHLHKNELATAREYYAAALAGGPLEVYRRERIWLHIAETHAREEDYEEARQAYDRAVRDQKAIGDEYGLALSHQGLGEVFVQLGDRELARDHSLQAYAYQRRSGDLDRFWKSCVLLAETEVERGHPDEAVGYWQQARGPLVDEGGHFRLPVGRSAAIRDLAEKLLAHLEEAGPEEARRQCLEDLVVLCDRDDIRKAELLIKTGEAHWRAGEWKEGLKRFQKACETATSWAVRAQAFEHLGDALGEHEMSGAAIEAVVGIPRDKDPVEHCYRQAIQQCLRAEQAGGVPAILGKLTDRLLGDESIHVELPRLLLDILQDAKSSAARQTIVSVVKDRLLQSQTRDLQTLAADVLVYASRQLIRQPDPDEARDEILAHLEEAEAIYREQPPADRIWGLYMLIPLYYQLGGHVATVAAFFEELIELSLETEDTGEFVATYAALTSFRQAISQEELRKVLESALAAFDRLDFDPLERLKFKLLTGKFFVALGEMTEEEAEREEVQRVALAYYDEVLTDTVGADETLLALVGSALNDSALILGDDQVEEALRRLREAVAIDEYKDGELGACESRSNLASLLARTGAIAEARQAFELAIRAMRERVMTWKRRFEHLDRPLTADEVPHILHDKESLALGIRNFIGFLLEQGPRDAIESLAREASGLFREVEREHSARSVEQLASFSTMLSRPELFAKIRHRAP